MKLWLLPVFFFLAAPAFGERLQFDHRLYPPLQKVLDGGDPNMLHFNDKNPARLVDLIAIKGKSAKNWTEALEIVAIRRPGDVTTARGWMDMLQQQSVARCRASFEVISEDQDSVTFERLSPECPEERAEQEIYRLVAGKRSWFQLVVLVKGRLDAQSRQQWLALLASAKLQ